MVEVNETRNWWFIQNTVYHTLYKKINSFIEKEGKRFMLEDFSTTVVPNDVIHDKTISDKEIAQFVIDNLK